MTLFTNVHLKREFVTFEMIIISIIKRTGDTDVVSDVKYTRGSIITRVVKRFLNDILHMSFLAGIHIFKAFPAYTTTEL